MATQVGIIKKFVKTLMETNKTGIEAADAAFKAVGAGNYTAFKAEFNSAHKGYSNQVLQDFLEQNCGIRINNDDTGAITGSDAGGKTTKTAKSIMPEAAKAVNLTDDEYNSFTKNGLTVNIEYEEVTNTQAGANFNYDSEIYLEKQKLVVRALYNWWIPESLDLINESLGINFTDGRARVNEINIEFDREGNYSTKAVELDFDYDLGLAAEITLTINADLLYNLTKSDKDGTLPKNCYVDSDIYGSTNAFTNYLDRLLLVAMAEVALAANVPYANKLPEDISGGLCALVGGYDDASKSYSSFTGTATNEITGYARLRYLAKNYSDGNSDGVSYNSKKTILTLTTDFTENTLDLADFESTVKNVNASALKNDIKIIGNTKNNSIVGGKGNDSILGGNGNDTLSGGTGNDTLKGGKGNDLFIYTAGNDVITDYAAEDKISINETISNAEISGSDVVLTIGENILTVKNAKDKELTIIDSEGAESTMIVSGSTEQNLTNADKVAVTLKSGIKTADASARTKAIKITGNNLDNIIIGGTKNDSIYGGNGNDYLSGGTGNDKIYGQNGNDTLWGGFGNDTLIGGDGADIFLYASGEGKDIISDFENNDMLLITGAFSASYNKKTKALAFKVDSTANAITLKNFTATNFNINGFDYEISGNNLKRK